MAKQEFSLEFCGRKLLVEIGEIAKQAGGSVLVRYEDTVVLSAATASKQAKEGIDFFPLTVSFEEKLYSVGKIPGGFLRREGRPSEHATLTARMIDRPIRPLFAEGFRNEVQVVNTVLSVNQDCTPEMTAMFGASLAICISDIPFNGPIAGVQVGRINGEYVINPSVADMELSDINLSVAGTKEAINMVESSSKEVSEEAMLEALMFGHEYIKKLCDFQIEIASKVAKEKMEIVLDAVDSSLEKEVRSTYETPLVAALKIKEKLLRYGTIDDLCDACVKAYSEKDYADDKSKASVLRQANTICRTIVKEEMRRLITVDKIRPDGRKVNELRPLNAQIDLLPRVHGSALFTRGETQVLSTCTLGAMGDIQIVDDLTEVENKRFMHHYNFPPYSVGEVGRMGNPGRREIGHGALGEKALLQVIPSIEDFPYAIRCVSEVVESNGSSSQASICASTMALMAAGVPIKAPVAGIAMGLIKEGNNYTILTDIQGMEDHEGDMDFKVAGTAEGICALQMDIKTDGITREIFKEALAQAHDARQEILATMAAAIAKPRDEVSTYAPKMFKTNIPVDKIREVIGPSGKMINQIIAECDNVKIDIEDDGRVVIYHTNMQAIKKAIGMIENIVRVAKVGEIYEAKVVRIEKFGAFVSLYGNVDGLLHVSKIKWERIDKVEDVLKIGDIIKVVVTEIDEKGRVNVSSRDLLPKPEGYVEPERTEHKPREFQKRPFNKERRD